MVFRKSDEEQTRTLQSQKVRTILLALATALYVLWGQHLAVAAPKVISAQPYPVGDLQISRENLAPAEYRFTLKNLNIAGAETNRARSHTWMLAGARGVTPTVEVESASYVHLRNGLVTTTTLSPPDQVRQNLVRVADLGLLRQYWVYTFTVTTASPAGQDNFWVLDEAVLKVNVGKPTSPLDEVKASRWDGEFGEERLPGGMMLNPDIPSDYYTTDYNDPVEAWADWTQRTSQAAKSGGLFRFSSYGGGLYRISAKDVATSTGKQVKSPAKDWRIYLDGQEIPVLPGVGAEEAESVYLPLAPTELDGLHELVFWLDTSGKNVSRQPPLRMAAPDVPEISSKDGLTSTGSFGKTHRKFVDYNPKLKAGPGADRWIWLDLGSDSAATVNLEMPEYFNPLPGSQVRVSIKYGFANFPPVQPALLLLAGTSEAGQTSLTVQQGTATLDVDPDLLKAGDNPLALRLVYPDSADQQRPVSLQYIRTDWTQSLPVPGNEVVTFSASAQSTGPKGLQFDSALSDNTAVIGFQNNNAELLEHQGNVAAWQNAGHASYMVGSLSAAKPVPVLSHVAETALLSQFESAQSVVIAADKLSSSSQALVAVHEGRGLSAKLHSTRNIYDAFSYGKPDPNAIRSFLRYLFYKAQGDVPEYVTLVGEASDFRGDPTIVPPTTQENLLPASAANSPDTPQGDQQYSSALGSDLVADFIVGRIPAATEKQVADFAEKMQIFESAPAGEWSRLTRFVMDDNDEFPDVVGRIVAEAMSPNVETRLFRQWDFEYVPNLRVPGKKRSWTATKTLIDDFNDGMAVLNFFGHGGPNLWSHERLLHLSDLPEITNSERLPLITCASCDNAWISYPAPPVKASMGEQMVLKPDGGALALFGPVAGASPYEHSTLVQSLMEGVTRTQLRTVGDLIFYAENTYYAVTRSASIPDQYLLLGDPTVSMPMPRVQPSLSAEVVKLEAKNREIKFSLVDGVELKSTGTLRIMAGGGEEELAFIPINPGERTWPVALPEEFTGGVVRALLEWSAGSEVQLAGVTVSVMPPKAGSAREPILLATEGNQYTIEVPQAGAERLNGNTNTYNFVLRSTEESTAPVRIIAVDEQGTRLSEVPRIEVTTGTEGNRFDLNFNSPLQSPATTISLQILPVEASDNMNDPKTTVTYLLPSEGQAELAFVPGTAKVYTADDGEFVSGKTIFLEAEIVNEGEIASSGFTLQALRENPTTGTELQTINESNSYRVEGLAPGERRRLAFRWENTTGGTYDNVFLVANRNKIVRESEFDDNSITMPPIEVLPVGNFLVTDYNVEPTYAVSGTTVAVSAVLENNRLLNDHPVTVEVGWGRSFDGETSSTRYPVQFEDGFATVSREMVVPEHFAYGFLKVNADLEIEELDGGDNTTQTHNMIVTPLAADTQSTVGLAETIVAGVGYNLDHPFDNMLRVTPNFTSTTEFLLVDHANITTGSASGQNVADDNAWWVVPWRVAAAAGESPGEIGFRLPLGTVSTDVPGILRGYFVPERGEQPMLDVLLGDGVWTRVTASGGGSRPAGEFGRLYTSGGALDWQMRKVNSNDSLVLEYITFTPHAVEWKSPPYLLPENLRSELLNFSMDTDSADKWEALYVEWRNGRSIGEGDIDWSPWQSVSGLTAPLSSEEYLQVRVIGVPVQNEKPYLQNFRLTKQ